MPVIYKVPLSAIREIQRSELEDKRLQDLLHGYSSFGEVLGSRNEPITLDGSSSPPIMKNPLDVTDGRHRVYIARQKGLSHVPAQVFVSEKNAKIYLTLPAIKKCEELWHKTRGECSKSDFEKIANSLYKHVRFEASKCVISRDKLEFSFDCIIDSQAKENLTIIGAGLNGSCR